MLSALFSGPVRVDEVYAPLFEGNKRHHGCSVTQIEKRGVTLAQLRRACKYTLGRAIAERWTSVAPERRGQPLTEENLTLNDFVQLVVLPATARRDCSFVELVATKPQPPRWLVSVWGGQPLAEVVACLEQHVNDHRDLSEDDAYWVYACAANPREQASELPRALTVRDLAFHRVMSSVEGAVTLLDRQGTALSARAWCALELYEATHSRGVDLKHEVYTAVQQGDDDDDQFPADDAPAVGLTDGYAAFDLGSAATKARRERAFPALLASRALDFKLEAAQAASEEDREGIVGLVGDDAGPFNSTVCARVGAALLVRWLDDIAAGHRTGIVQLAPSASAASLGGGSRRSSGGSYASSSGGGGGGLFTPCGARARSRLPPDAAPLLGPTLANLKASHLRKLEVIRADADKPVGGSLLSPNLPSTLEELRLRGVSAEVAHGAARLLRLADLRVLQLHSCALDDRSAEQMGKAVLNNGSLRELDLAGNAIGDAGMRALGAGLQRCRRLALVDLSANRISDNGAAALAQVLTGCKTVRVLDLSSNRIGDTGVTALAQGVSASKKLFELQLSDNKLTDRGVAAIASALTKAKALAILGLSHNSIGDGAANALGEALLKRTALSALFLDGNRITDDGSRLLTRGLVKNRTLRTLYIQTNALTDEGVMEIRAVWDETGRNNMISNGRSSDAMPARGGQRGLLV